MKPRSLNWEEVTFSVECLPEDAPIKGNVMDSGDTDVDAREEERIYNAYQTNEWAWCCVRVVAKWKCFEADRYLCCCSYESEEDFMQGGYFDDLANDALYALDKKITEAFEAIRPLLETCPD